MASPMNWRVTSNFLRKYIVRNVNIAKHKSTNKKYHPPRPRRPLTLHLTEQLPEDLSRFEDIKTDRKESAKKEERILSVNIGLSRERNVLSNRKAFRKWTKTHKSLEPVARFKKLKLDLAEVKDAWHQEYGQSHMYRVACHYGIFRDLFGHAYFMPRIPMNIFYDYDDELVTPVYTGNKILPSEATVRPHVIYESDPDSLWTLILTSPDSHPLDNAVETLHWFIGNIKGSDVDSGDMIREYLQPFPVKGTGFHRYVFILYKQEHRIEYDPETVNLKTAGSDLEGRTFHTLEFYRKFQEQLTPASFRFFQSEWDDSVTDVFWNILNSEKSLS